MINKKGVWFITLFSLILVLSVYYITMPTELLISNKKNTDEKVEPTVQVEESDILVSLRVEADEKMEKELKELKEVISNAESTVEEKNEAFEKIKSLNANRSEEESLEKKIQETFKLDSFVKIEDSGISVIVNNAEGSDELANNIMRSIQENYDTKKSIAVKFQK